MMAHTKSPTFNQLAAGPARWHPTYMLSRQAILNVLGRERDNLRNRFGVKRIALFGSYARGDATEASDVDLLVEVDPAIGLRFVELADYIESALGVRTEVVSRVAVGERQWRLIEPELIYVE